MSEYIKRSEAMDVIVNVLEHTECKDEHIDRVLENIYALPPVDILYCVSCKHYDGAYCHFHDTVINYPGYCSFGEVDDE